MNYLKKEMLSKAVSAAIFSLLTIFSLFIMYVLIRGKMGVAIIIPIVMLLSFGFMTWLNFSNLKDAIKMYKDIKDRGILDTLDSINTFSSDAEMRNAYKAQMQNSIYSDEDFVITEDFFAARQQGVLFIVNGILDVKVQVNKVNGIIARVSLDILYYDGEKYEFCFGQSFETPIKQKLDTLQLIANILAQRSENYRKHSNFLFLE